MDFVDTELKDSADYELVERAIGFIEKNHPNQPSLDEIASSVSLSKFHFDRVFTRWAGITPIQFMQYLTLDFTKKRLLESKSVLNASLDAGLSGPGRLHDLFVNFEAITPGEYKQLGKGLVINYGHGRSPFGRCFVATTKRGICYLGFEPTAGKDECLNQLQKNWPNDKFIHDRDNSSVLIQSIFNVDPSEQKRPFHLYMKGTNFQVNVWRALLSIPEGNIVSYQNVSTYLERPTSFRAVAGAIAKNPVAYLIPCHRVISKAGSIHHYRWGDHRKKALIAFESAKHPE